MEMLFSYRDIFNLGYETVLLKLGAKQSRVRLTCLFYSFKVPVVSAVSGFPTSFPNHVGLNDRYSLVSCLFPDQAHCPIQKWLSEKFIACSKSNNQFYYLGN